MYVLRPGRVLHSFEAPDGLRCVDLFVRQDGTFGFEEYRRDPEDPSGWQLNGGYQRDVFQTEDQAKEALVKSVPWLSTAHGDTQM